MATVLDRELKRQIDVDGTEYMLTVTPDGMKLAEKVKRNPIVALTWRDLVNGETALALALQASLRPD